MPTVRFALNDEYYTRLENDAKDAHMNIQDYIRFKLFNERTIFTVDEAVRRIKEGNWENIEFTLPDVYGDDWTMSREDGAGALVNISLITLPNIRSLVSNLYPTA